MIIFAFIKASEAEKQKEMTNHCIKEAALQRELAQHRASEAEHAQAEAERLMQQLQECRSN